MVYFLIEQLEYKDYYFYYLIIIFILIGIVIINSSYFRYYDLKKIIALSLILHLNLTFHAMLSLNSSGIYCAIVIPFQYHLLIL